MTDLSRPQRISISHDEVQARIDELRTAPTKNTHGGARPGAGRPPRDDDRAGRLVRIWLTDDEHTAVLTLSTDERREALLKAVRAKS
jgi:hypothetical protein